MPTPARDARSDSSARSTRTGATAVTPREKRRGGGTPGRGSGPRLIAIANRLPVHRAGAAEDSGTEPQWQSSAGGLVTALHPILRAGKGVWIGWTGSSGEAPRAFDHEGVRIVPVGLSEEEVESYYNGMSNRTLWPLYHDAIRAPDFHKHWWAPYVAVNERFAKAAARACKPGDLVWVHDYHLQLVPAMLRALRPDVRIGFFLHIPFPPEELFEWLPWRRQILEGLLGADLVGFQTMPGVRNFVRLAREYAGAEGEGRELSYQGRTVRVGAFPISIETSWWEAQASQTTTINKASEIRSRLGRRRKIILAVDRLDYTKGITLRLNAFEELLRTKRVKVDDCVLVQVAVPSREVVGEYAKLRVQVEQTVGRINGDYSQPGKVAVHYFRRNLTREELVAYYRAADVMVVTPLRDGMNLVAKEYVACRMDSTGVLVLSEFAGAARELTRAILVNPRDVDGLAGAMHQGLAMAQDEARMRMAMLRARVRRHDVHEWARIFLEALASATPARRAR